MLINETWETARILKVFLIDETQWNNHFEQFQKIKIIPRFSTLAVLLFARGCDWSFTAHPTTRIPSRYPSRIFTSWPFRRTSGLQSISGRLFRSTQRVVISREFCCSRVVVNLRIASGQSDQKLSKTCADQALIIAERVNTCEKSWHLYI